MATPASDIEALKRQIAEMQAKLAAAEQTAAPHIQGNVHIPNGDFIGRDFIQITTQITHTGEDPKEAQSVVAHYLTALTNTLAGLELSGIDKSAAQPGQKPLDLKDIYVPLSTTQRIPANRSLKQWLSTETDQREPRAATGKMRLITALEALAKHRALTLLGKPGSGKSTFGATVLLTLAQAWRDGQPPALGATWTHGALLPIRVILRRFAEKLPPGGEMAQAGDLWDFIGADLDAGGYGLSGRTMEYVQRIVRDHGALILFDGLDECGDNVRRERVLNAVNDLMRSAGENCRFVLTARPYAWRAGPDPARGVYALADLDDAQIEQFIHAWYAALVQRGWRSPAEAARKRDDLLKVRARPDLLPLAQNPLLLTLMTTLHTNRGRLPDDRADLYNDSVELLMQRWNEPIGAGQALLDKLDMPGLKLSHLRDTLEALAFEIHERNVGHDGAADIGEDRLVRAFFLLLNSRDKAADVVEYIEKRAGLLIGQGEKDGERQFAFPHRTFQEFLAACHLAAKDNFAAECVRLARAAAAHWQVVLPLAARLAKAERGAGAADALIHGVSIRDFAGRLGAIDWACALLAGNQLLEIGLGALNSGDHTCAIAARVAGWIAAGLPRHPDEGGTPALQRAQAGDVLAALGDPRFDPQRFHLPNDRMLGFILIPADPDFCIGTRRADVQRGRGWEKNEINDQPTPTPDFYLARYPVTVAQFRAYVADGGEKPAHDDALRYPDNRPVTLVSWHEARAYCDWLNHRLPALPDNTIARLLEAGWRFALPSEMEWEKAARGGLRNKAYPWGDDADPNRANYENTGIGDTSAVGCFPANDYGLHDMSGNMWEWTRSLHRDYPYRPEDGREKPDAENEDGRIVRGGGWGNLPGEARCACRRTARLDGHYGFPCFRVVLRSSPV
ncbi:MAG: SUMF1/EgtB/PvdO family nonheme iron enzyme [Kiritimatiellia bacterium]